MRKIFICFVFIFVWGLPAFGQVKKPTPTPQNSPTQNATPQNIVEDDNLLIVRLAAAKNSLFMCFENYFESKADNKLQVYSDCRESKIKELAEIYSELSKKPNAIKLLLSDEMSEHYKDSSSRLRRVGRTESESNLNSQTELQRIIVIQNQRIIELLEKMANKK